jgi:hypothetical protein
MDIHYGIKKAARQKINVKVLTHEIEKIKKRQHGRIVPKDLVLAAVDPSHPLHRYFEWDDKVAGEQYRIAQAAKLLRIIVYVTDGGVNKNPIVTRAYVNVVVGEERFYTDTISAMSEPESCEYLFKQAKRDLITWKQKYGALKEFRDLIAFIDKTVT